MSSGRRIGASLAGLVLAAGVGCTPATPNTPTSSTAPTDGLYHLSDQFKDLRFVWTAAPGVDLTTGPMVPVRAYIESETLTFKSSKTANLYPGFDRAVPQNGNLWNSSGEAHLRLWDPPEVVEQHHEQKERTHTWGGVDRKIVLSLTSTPGGGWAAVICEGGYSQSTRLPDGKWGHVEYNSDKLAYADPSQVIPAADWGWITRVEVRQDPSPPAPSGQAPADVERAQTGPLPAPQADVFGNWRITGRLSGAPPAPPKDADWPQFETVWPDGSWGPDDWKRAHEECMAKAPDPRETRVKWLVGEHDGPYPYPGPLPASTPGWPAAREG